MSHLMHTITIRDSWGTELRLEPDHTDDSDNPCIRFKLKLDRSLSKDEADLDVRIDDAEDLARWLLHAVFGEDRVHIEIKPSKDEM